MADNPGRGYLPPNVPNPGPHRRQQWPVIPPQAPPTFYNAPQPWQVSNKPYLHHPSQGSSSPQSESLDLSGTNFSGRALSQPEPAHNGDPINGQLKEVPASVSVIAPNPLVQPEEFKLSDKAEAFGSKMPFERQSQADFIGADGKMPAFPSASKPVTTTPEAKGLPVHPFTSKPQDQAGIPTPFEGKGPPPAESQGTPSHPVESKVSARPLEGGKPLEPLIAPAVPAVVALAHEQRPFINPGLPQDEPALPPVSNSAPIVEPLAAPPAPAPPPSPPPPVVSQVPSVIASGMESANLLVSKSSDPLPPAPHKQQAHEAAKPTAPLAPVPDHVESLLEDMFQGGDDSPVKHSVIVANTKAPALTEDKVVAILQDEAPLESDEVKNEVGSEIKTEVKTEVKTEPDKGQKFMEVESELEKMFAGIVEPVEDAKPPVTNPMTNAQQSGSKATPASTPKSEQPKKRKRVIRKPRKSIDSDGPPTSSKGRGKKPAEKAKGVKRRAAEKGLKEGSDNSNLGAAVPKKGPYVLVEGPKELPTKIRIVNSGGSRDEEEKDHGMDKAGSRRKHRHAEGRLKGAGLYSSTLSLKYNAHSADLTWVCSFCKLRSNCERGLGGEPAGDLFGPYILTIPKEPEHDPRDPKDSDVVAEQKKKGGGKQASLRAVGAADQFIKDLSKKTKKHQLPGEDMSGEREIWVHEKCVVWAPGVFLVGPHLVGLAEAIAAASVTKCSYCSQFGASLGCVQRNCPARCHYGCAVATRWDLNYNTFIAKCPNHTKPKKP